MKKKIYGLLAVISGLFLWGCYPQGADYIEDMDVVITTHNDVYDFVSKGNYAMPDKIVKVTGNLAEGDDPEFIPSVNAKVILDRIELNMTELGWTKVSIADSANIDVLLVPVSWETTTILYYYDYWSWWYGGYYPYWGYGGYPGYGYTTSYTTGTLLMTMIDPKEMAGNGAPITQWSGALNGILTGSFSSTRVNNLIDKAFNQSPYLLTK
jgi:Domain of unknown function (DUF4136)